MSDVDLGPGQQPVAVATAPRRRSTRPRQPDTGQQRPGTRAVAPSVTEPAADLEPIHVLHPATTPSGTALTRGLRLLPTRRRHIGPWCFVEHQTSDAPGQPHPTGANQTRLAVPAHPHTGLQLLTWLFAGAVEHRASVGDAVIVQPGELVLLTAGRGASHSLDENAAVERMGEGPPSRAVRLAALLPPTGLGTAPTLEHHAELPSVEEDGIRMTVALGTLCGLTSPATTFRPLLCAQLDLAPGTHMALPVDQGFEHGLLVDTGTVNVDGVRGDVAQLVVVPAGRPYLRLTAGDAPVRLLLIGGPPHQDPTVVWWGLAAQDHDDVASARADWAAQRTRRARGADPAARFGRVDDDAAPASAPPLSGIRLCAPRAVR